ncbi:MAG: hypothetical protein WC917_00625 [Bacilli bacterium]|jgi:hypothetical protein
MSEEKNIFDLYNIDDLPKKIRGRLDKIKHYRTTDLILNLFESRKTLSINEIQVGLYRLYNKIVNRAALGNALYKLNKSKKIKRTEWGIYEKI